MSSVVEQAVRNLSPAEICGVEHIATITSNIASAVRTYRATNANGSKCDVVVVQGVLHKEAYCVQHDRTNDCEGASRVLASFDFEQPATR